MQQTMLTSLNDAETHSEIVYSGYDRELVGAGTHMVMTIIEFN
jgi:hypothetical protein